MRQVYCANCGTRLNIIQKALPKFGVTVAIAEYHECLDEPIELNLTPIEIPKFENPEGKDKFVQNLDKLDIPIGLTQLVDGGLRDRRPNDQVKSNAPKSVLDRVRQHIGTMPVHDPTKIEDPDYEREPKGIYRK